MSKQMTESGKHSEANKPAALPASDARRATEDMIAAIDALRAVYLEENKALEAADTNSFLGLQDRKVEAALNYQASAAGLIGRKKEMGELPESLRDALTAKYAEFADIAERNLNHLNRMQGSIKRLNDRLMRAARENAAKDGVNYSAKGHLQRYSRQLSIGLNESA